jgi:tetratricopeptide (TPR) repeat protein
MPARSIVLAALAFFLPVLPAAQTVKSTAARAISKSKPDLSGQEAVIEKMSLVVRYTEDGSCVRTLVVKEHILSDAGVRDAGILSIPFASAAETVTFNYMRVHKPSGEVVETPAEDAQEVAAPVTESAPMYSDLRVKQLPVRSLSVDDTLEYQVTVHATDADAPGEHSFVSDFMTEIPVREQTIELRVPLDFVANITVKSVHPTTTDEKNERVYRWTHETVSEYPKKEEKDQSAPVQMVQEMFDPDIAMSGFQSWAQLGAWYRGLIKDRAVPNAEIQAKADELTRGLATDDAKVDAIYNYVSTQFRYIAVSLGIGRLQPHTAAEVFRNRYGDCKDKHTLLQAMLAAEEIEAEPVLINSSMRLNPGLLVPSQFDHVITLVKLKDHDVWLDSTPEIAPSRMLLAGLRDKQALAIPATGDARLVQTEAALPFPSFVHETINGKLETGGVLTAHFDLTLRGDAEVLYRELYHRVPRANWQTLTQNISEHNGFGGEVSAVDASLPEKTEEPFHVQWDYTRKDFGDWPNLRFPQLATWFQSKFATGVTPPKRQIALDTTGETWVKTTLTLPEGYAVTAPADVKRSTAFAEYRSTYKVKDRMLAMNYTVQYKVRELPWDSFQEYVGFVNSMGDDASQMIQLAALPTFNLPMLGDKSDTEAAALIAEADEKRRVHDLEGARELLDKAKARNDHQLGLWAEYGAVDWFTNRTQAIPDYKKELEQHPEDFAAYEGLASSYSGEGQWSDAEQTMQMWAKFRPSDSRPYSELGGLQLAEKHYKEAEASFHDAIRLSTAPDQLKLELGEAQLKAGDTDAGKKTLHALMDKSEDPVLLNGAAYELGDAGLDLPASEMASRKAIQVLETRTAAFTLAGATNQDFNNVMSLAATWDTLGWIEFKENKLAEAESYVRSAWLLLPEAEAGEHMGEIYEAEGKKQDAIAAYRQAASRLWAEHLTPQNAQMKETMQSRANVLEGKAKGAAAQDADDEPEGMHAYTVTSPLNGAHARAEFLLLMGHGRVEGVRFLSGDEDLKQAIPALQAVAYRFSLPPHSQAKILRRCSLACTEGEPTCMLRLVPAGAASITP